MKTSELRRNKSVILPVETVNRNHFKQYRSLSNLSKLTSLSDPWSYHPLKKKDKFEKIFHKFEETNFNFKKKLNFKGDKFLKNALAKDYVYLGSLIKTVFNQTGLTLDEEGNLLFIKGKRSDLFNGLYKKYIKTNKYLTCKINLNNSPSKIQFKSLFINKNGQLIGIDKKAYRPYSISFENPREKNPREPNEINVAVCYAPEHGGIEYDLTFEYVNEGRAITSSFYLKDGKLYLTVHCAKNGKKNYLETEYEINLPLKMGWRIDSIKKTVNVLQIEIKNESWNKTRITYLDPHSILLEKQAVKYLSHKPPQNLISGLGNDPHESYFSGQPFSSTRVGNFSSKYIPLIAPVVDKFRVALKRAKPFYYQAQSKSFLKEIGRSVDPCFEYLIKRARKRFAAYPAVTGEFKEKKRIYAEHKLQFIQNTKALKDVLADSTVYVDRHEKLSCTISNVLSQLKCNETLVFSSIDELGLFFGIAAGGIPFCPGWFAGIVAVFKNQYGIAITKRIDSFQFEFTHRMNKAVIPLLGTGQGLEDDNKPLKTSGVDMITVLPIEANLILIVNVVRGSSFSFNLKEKEIVPFIENLTDVKKIDWLGNTLIEESQIHVYEEHNLIIQLETKSELRGELGFMANSRTYLVLPRTALGIRLALQLITFQKRTETRLGNKECEEQTPKSNFTISVVGQEADFFEEAKIMPIALKSDYMGTDNVWCFPLPLLEEYNAIATYRKDPVVVRQCKHEREIVEAIPHYFHIGKDKLPSKIQSLVHTLYTLFSEKKASEITYQCYVPPKLDKIKLFGTKENFLIKLREQRIRIDAQPANIIDDLNQLRAYYSNLDDMIRSVDLIVANSERKSLHKASYIQMHCIYRLTESGFEELKNRFFETLHTMELKSKNDGIMSLETPFDFEIETLKEINASLANENFEHGFRFVLRKIEITRRSHVEKRLDTLQFALLRARQTMRVELIQPIGIIDLACDDNGKSIEVMNCMLMEF